MNLSEGKCRDPRCETRVVMINHNRTGNPAPIEALPSDNGNIIIDRERGVYIILTKDELKSARERGLSLHLNHFASCQFARRFGKKKAKAAAA